MLASVVVLNLYLNFNHITRIFSDKILGVPVLSAEEIDSLCEGKQDTYLEPFLTLPIVRWNALLPYILQTVSQNGFIRCN